MENLDLKKQKTLHKSDFNKIFEAWKLKAVWAMEIKIILSEI